MGDPDVTYGKNHEYRVFSELDNEPDSENSGRRLLHIRMVWWRSRHWGGIGPVDYPTVDDVFAVGHETAKPNGHSIEELLLDLGRMQKAVDKPALIFAEWAGRLTRRGWYSGEALDRLHKAWKRATEEQRATFLAEITAKQSPDTSATG